MRAAATNVTQGIVPHSGHWVMEENPTDTIKLITEFLAKQREWSRVTLGRRSLFPCEQRGKGAC